MSRIPPKVKSPEQALEQSMRECFQDITREFKTFSSELRTFRSELGKERYDDQQGMRPSESSRFDDSPPQMSHSTYNYQTFNEQ